jgi:hypothetical protein
MDRVRQIAAPRRDVASVDCAVMNKNTAIVRSVLALCVCLFSSVALACSCGCGVFEVGTDAMFPNRTGAMVFAEYDFMNQNENWHGSSRAPSGDNEDKRISTGFMNFGVQYVFNRAWGLSVGIPYWQRYFKTTDEDTGDPSSATHSALGDIRIKGVYSGFSPDMATGITFGLKLPTGDSSYSNFDPDTEIGSGSTDTLLGAYHLGRLDADGRWSWFVNALWQQPIAHKNSYRPGAEVDAVVGAQYSGWSIGNAGTIALVLQLKGVFRDHDGGRMGDSANSGYTRYLITPGLQVDTRKVSVYMDFGIPLYTDTTGNQLVAPLLWKVNAAYHF